MQNTEPSSNNHRPTWTTQASFQCRFSELLSISWSGSEKRHESDLRFYTVVLKEKLYEATHKDSLVSGLHQVISRALSVWGLDLVPRDSSDPAAVRAKSSPIAANAYICNYRCPLPILFFSPNLMKSIAGSTGLPSGDLEISGSISTHSWRALSW